MAEDLVLWLRRIKDESRRSLRELERATHISNSALSRYLSGQAVPPWNAVVALCSAAGADPRPLRPLWEQAQRARRGRGRQFDVARPAARQFAARNDLPRDVAAFTGRRAEVAQLSRLARAGHAAAIDGMGGVGKTGLAVHVAHELAAEFPDCQLYIDLHGFTPGREPREPGEALLILLRALDVPVGRIADTLEERAALWRSELAGRRAVVVLDNAADADHVRPLLPGAGRHAVLVTSRRRLVDLDGVEPVSLAPLSAADAAELFGATLGIGADTGDDAIAADIVHAAAIDDLMLRCGGLPLTIRIAAARLRHRRWTVADLLDRSPSGESGIAQVIDASLGRLTAPQQRMFRMLGVFPGAEIEPCAAAALAGIPAAEAAAALDELVDANLLEEPSPKRYRFHDLIRQRAVEAARDHASAEEREVALDRLTDFHLHVIALVRDRLDDKLEGSVDHIRPVRHVPQALPALDDLAQMMAWYEAEAATVDLIIGLTIERGRDDLIVQFALTIGAFLGRRGEMEQWHRITAEAAEAAERRENPGELAGVRYFRGVAHRFVGRLAEAEADFAAVHDFALASPAGTGMRIIALWRLASIAEDRGDFLRVLELRRQTSETPGVERYPTHLAFATITTTRSLIYLGRSAEAEREARSALASPQAEDPALRIIALRALGHAQLAQGEAQAALETFVEGVAVSREMGHVSYVAVCRGDAAQALSSLGRHAEALDEHDVSVTWATDHGELHREIFQREAFGRACLAAGDLDRAELLFRRSLELAAPRGFRHVAAMARLGLADALGPSPESAELRAEAYAAYDFAGQRPAT